MNEFKYFDLFSDKRFPTEIPEENDVNWQSFTKNFICPENISIYLIRSKNKYYVESDGRGNRPREHKNDFIKKKHKNKYMQRIFNKTELSEFHYCCLVTIPKELEEFRNQIENSYIKLFDTYKNGYNLMEFADTPTLGRKMSQKTKEKIRLAKTGKEGVKQSEERKREVSIRIAGDKNPMFGKLHSEETKLKMAQSQSGEKNHCFGREFSKEHCEKISNALKGKYSGENSPIFGVKKSKEHVEKMVATKVKTYTLVSPDGEKITFTNMRKFCRKNNLRQGNIHSLATGKLKSSQGWTRIN